MLARKNRLPLRKMPDFFTQSRRFFTKNLTFFYQNTEGQAQNAAQIAIIIPKKAVPLSTSRHKYKRQIAGVIRAFLLALENKQIVITATKQIIDSSPEQLSAEIKKFVEQIEYRGRVKK